MHTIAPCIDKKTITEETMNSAHNVIVTFIPNTSKEIQIPDIDAANKTIVENCDGTQISVIDLNHFIAPEGILLTQYSNDGLHLNKKGTHSGSIEWI